MNRRKYRDVIEMNGDSPKLPLFKYKGYYSQLDFSFEDDLFYGQIDDIRDLVSYHGKSVWRAERNFRNAVLDYLELCKHIEKIPEEPKKPAFVPPAQVHIDSSPMPGIEAAPMPTGGERM